MRSTTTKIDMKLDVSRFLVTGSSRSRVRDLSDELIISLSHRKKVFKRKAMNLFISQAISHRLYHQ